MQVTYHIQATTENVEPREGKVISRSIVPTGGAGTELKNLIAKFGLKPGLNCKCGQHIREMDQKGVEWCEQNISTITEWLREEAQRARLPFTEIGAKLLIKRAISNARKKQKGEQDMTVKLVVEIDSEDVYDAFERTRPKEGKVTAATAEPAKTTTVIQGKPGLPQQTVTGQFSRTSTQPT